MQIKTFSFNPFQTNCYLCHHNGEAVLVDASSHLPLEHQAIIDYIESHGLTVRHLLLTHAHIDHILGCAALGKHFGLPFQMHQADLPFITRSKEQAAFFGLTLEATPVADTFLQEGDTVTFGEVTWEVLHAPGHSPGSICFFDAQNDLVLSGDVLFYDSIGRTDLPQGSYPQLMRSIHEKLLPLGDGTYVYPGHGPSTTVGRERAENPFLTNAPLAL